MLSKLLASLKRVDEQTQALYAVVAAIVVFTGVASTVRLVPVALGVAFIPLFFALAFLVFKRVGFEIGTILVLMAGLALYLAYLGYTEFGERNYDGPNQLDYIQFVADHGRRPPAARCLVCHHPPLYYFLSAGVLIFFQRTRMVHAELGLQIFSLLLFVTFLVFAVKLIQRFTKDVGRVRLATALIVFWPYSVMMSVRVHNDALAATLMMAALFFFVVYHEESRPRDLYLASLFTGLGLLTKSSSFILVALIFAVLALKLWRSKDRLHVLGRGVVVGGILALAMFLNTVGRSAPPTHREKDFCHRVLGNACNIGKHEWVGNEPYNYIYVDVANFLKEPYLIAGKDGSRRELFWNDFVKTSLFGTQNKLPDRETAYEFNRGVAGVMNGVLAIMLGYLLIGVAFASKPAARRYGMIVLSIVASLAFMIAFRMMIPAPHHSDFRHVFVILVPTTILYVAVVGAAGRRHLALEWVGYGLGAALIALSIFYYLPKREIVMRMSKRVVHAQLSSYGRYVAEATPWDADNNLLFEENQTVEFNPPEKKTVSEFDVSLDNNDRYEITLYGVGAPRVMAVGPAGKKIEGLARYVQKVTPPVEGVEKITLRALSGDQAYSMGHLILH